ncbi:MAG TPA: hypothetical protein VFC16_02530 [Nakamurella sp.]|nr:hypothetical protein [Nakamurella sp.]
MSQQPASAAVMQFRLVAVVRDDDRILACRDHDTGVWRLPSTQWEAGINPLEAVRELLVDRAGVTVSPILHSPVRLSATAGLLLFTAKPLNVPPASTQLCRWLTPQSVPAVLPPGDQQCVSLTSTSAHRHAEARSNLNIEARSNLKTRVRLRRLDGYALEMLFGTR